MKQWNASIQFPADSDYVLRITDAEFGDSKRSGNPMLTIETEIVSPDAKEVAGEMITVAGVTPKKFYIVTGNVSKPDDDTNLVRAKERLSLLLPNDIELVKNMDGTNVSPEIVSKLKGLLFYAVVSSKATPKRKSPTQAQIEEAKANGKEPEGDVMKNPITGEPLNYYVVEVGEIFGPAPASKAANKPF